MVEFNLNLFWVVRRLNGGANSIEKISTSWDFKDKAAIITVFYMQEGLDVILLKSKYIYIYI